MLELTEIIVNIFEHIANVVVSIVVSLSVGVVNTISWIWYSPWYVGLEIILFLIFIKFLNKRG